ncbi:hypothetical protein [Romboutsia sp.]|uniref:hypothetical protein n=1 Tax=Romboutsia sp. TaxID=1965302 RepID=UPI003F3BEA40
MSFINKCFTIIRRSQRDVFNIRLDNDIVFDYFDKDNNFISSKTLKSSTPIDFTNCYFTLDKYDTVYGIYKDNSLKIIEINKGSSDFSSREILTYNYKKFSISFPYINVIDGNIHILYYVFNNNSNNTCALFHHYSHNGVWIENKIDFINHIVLDKFTVVLSQDSPIVFYFNLVDGYEEVFFSRFNISTFSWSNPVQITNSNKNKLYLSVLKDSMNFYHLTFCENTDNGYSVKYINGYLNENKLEINVSTYITGPSTCMYPTILKYDSALYLMWVNYQRLYTSVSNDLGKTWGEHDVDEFSVEEDFTRANFASNCIDDLPYNPTGVFTTYSTIGIIGF